MINWKYNPEDYNEEGYQLVPPGKYRIRIEKAEETTSKSGKDMIKLTLKVSGYNAHVWYYMVFDGTDADAIARTNDRLGRIFDSFAIPQGDMNLENWKGKVGAAEITNELDNKQTMRAQITWFLRRKEQESLPAWQEKPLKATAKAEDDFNPQPFNPESPIPF